MIAASTGRKTRVERQGDIMRTAEEIRAWVSEIVLRESGTWRPMQQVLEFIDSEPPCRHMNISRHSDRCYVFNTNIAARFCPDCGEKLEVK